MADLQQVAAAMAHAKRVELIDTVYGYMLIGIPSIFGMAAIGMLGSAVHQAAREAGGAIKSGLSYLRQGGRMVDQHKAYRDRIKGDKTGSDVDKKSVESISPARRYGYRLKPDDIFRKNPDTPQLTDQTMRGIGDAGFTSSYAPGGRGNLNDINIDANKFSKNEANGALDQLQPGGSVFFDGKDGDSQFYRKIYQEGIGERYINITDMQNQDISRNADQGRYDGLPVHTRADIMNRAYCTGNEEQ